AEVVGGADEALAEDLLPEAVHCDTRGERVGGARDPAGKAETIVGSIRERGESGGSAGGDFAAGVVPGATLGDVGGARLGAVMHDHDLEVAARSVVVLQQWGDLALFALAVLVDAVEEGEEAVVVALGEGVVLVVVALGAGHGEAEERGAGGVHA